MVSLFRHIIQNNPQIKALNMSSFSGERWTNGELVLESLLSSSIDSITDLNLSENRAWFNPVGVDLLAELISKQAGL